MRLRVSRSNESLMWLIQRALLFENVGAAFQELLHLWRRGAEEDVVP